MSSSSSAPIMTPSSSSTASAPTTVVPARSTALRWPSLRSPRGNTRRWPRASVITLDNFHDEPFRMFGSSNRANEVDRPLAVLALGFADNVDVAARLVLDVADCLAAAADDEADSAVGDENLD